ncbi:MAG TPA: hypothetical protein VNN79_11345 [Actinomycetota bacterium]|nr:hypothetical protein [Actinomycetota bacterium]
MARRTAVLAFPVALVLLAATALPALAAPGDLDPAFSEDGRARVGISGGATDVAIQPDGKIVAVGEAGGNFAVVRLKLDGTLDPTFSGDGIARISAGPGRFNQANAVAIRNGKIYVVGTSVVESQSLHALAMLRLNSNGTLDTTFSNDGFQLLRVGASSTGEDVAVQSDGKIIAVGTSDDEFLIVRRLANGDPDHGFSGDGSDRTGFAEDAQARTVAIDPTNGRIVVGGILEHSGISHDFAFAAYTRTGDLDHSFSGDGLMVRTTSSAGGLSANAILGNGKIVAVGTTNTGQPKGQMLVEQFTRAGEPDSTFGGGDGRTLVGFASSGHPRDDLASDMKVQTDGKIVVGGLSAGADEEFAVARLNANGTLDSTFHGGGVLTGFTKGAQSTGLAINNQTHKIVLVGIEFTSGSSSSPDAMLAARYLGT